MARSHTTLARFLREPVNGLTHLGGALAAAFGAAVLVHSAGTDPLRAISFTLYGASLVLLFLASAAYHALPVSPRAVARLRKIDHAMVSVLIAGTYTPVSLVALGGVLGWSLFGVSWALALVGLLVALLWIDAPRMLVAGLYLLAGWVGAVALYPLACVLPPAGIIWLIAGGLAYTGGAVIYVRKRPDPLPGRFGFHEIWHLFVLAGGACHYVMMWHLP